MAKKMRQIIKIDEDKCNGCGLCVTGCAEGALQVIDGKAKLVSETYCDGLGACIGECPQGAISFETREAEEFDEQKTVEYLKSIGRDPEAHFKHMQEHGLANNGGNGCTHTHHNGHVHGPNNGRFACPSARIIDRTRDSVSTSDTVPGAIESQLRQWPIKLYLVNPAAPYFQNADLLVAADCTAFAYGAIHPDFMRGKTIVTGCPKFDDNQVYLEKLTEIFSANNIKSITVLHMEVPCCSGMLRLVQLAVGASGKDIPVKAINIALNGEIKEEVLIV